MTHRRQSPDRKIQLEPAANAKQAIGDLEPGIELLIMTFGQFSLGDALRALIDQTGPCHVDISTWTAAKVDIQRAGSFMRNGKIKSMRWLVDRSFATRQPGYCDELINLFGPEAIRTTRTHAKYAVIRSDSYTLAVRTSMNLNANPRLEQIEISDSPALADFLSSVHDQAWAETPPGDMHSGLITPPKGQQNAKPKIKSGNRIRTGK